MITTCQTHQRTRPVASFDQAVAHVAVIRAQGYPPETLASFAEATGNFEGRDNCCADDAVARYLVRAAFRQESPS